MSVRVSLARLADTTSPRCTDAPVLATEHLARNAGALHLAAIVLGVVAVVADVERRSAVRQATIERLDLADPELETADRKSVV